MKLLDCTFRDGGYYTKWNFDRDLVNKYLNAIDRSDIDVVEIGFRYTPKKEKLGEFAYCTDEMISSLSLPSCDLAVMLNAKDFISYDNGPSQCVKDLFKKSSDSPLSWIRIASNITQVEACQSIAEQLKDMGYNVTMNVMQVADKDEKDIANVAKSLNKWGTVDVLYIADSLGSMDKDEIDRICNIIKVDWNRDLGFHGHNNKENALSNTFHAINAGANWVDGTVLGMGRGAGNTHTESLIVDLKSKGYNKYKPKSICSFASNEFYDLYEEYKWGPNLFYHLSATYRIHPTYVQEIITSDIYNKEQTLNCLENIKKSNNPNSFNKDVLSICMASNNETKIDDAMDIKIVIPSRYKSSRFPGKSLVDLRGKSLIERVWERCCMAIPEKDVFVATEDEIIRKHCEEKGIQVIMTTDKCLTGTDRVYEVSLNLDADLIINVQGDEPLISPNDIIKIINAYCEDPGTVYCGMCPVLSEEDFRSSSVPKVVTKDNNELLYMSRAPIPTDKNLGFINSMKQVCIYAFPKDALRDFGNSKNKSRLEQIEDIEILRFFELGYSIKMVEVSQSSIAIDYPKDVDRVIKAIEEYECIYG